MCTGGEVALLAGSAGLTVGGQALQNNAANNALKKQQQQISNSLTVQQGFDNQRRGVVEDNLEVFTPDNQKRVLDDQTQQTEDNLVGFLNAARSRRNNESGEISGKVSDAFETTRAAKTAEGLKKSIDRAKLIAKHGAPGKLNLDNSFKNADFLAKEGTLASEALRNANLGRLNIQSAGRQDVTANIAGSALQGVGSGLSTNKTALKAFENLFTVTP